MAYLIPSSIFKNVFADELRRYILPHITEIYDYTTEKIFTKRNNNEERLTSSAIIVLIKNSNRDNIIYHDLVNKEDKLIKKSVLKNKWFFKEDKNENKSLRFGDYFKASNTIATLYNKAFVINDYEENQKYIITKQGQKIEKKAVTDTSSPRTLNKGIKEKIIFPYYFKKGKLNKYTEEEFENEFPNVCQYLAKHKNTLNKRTSDNNAMWYEYGRSQAINNMNEEKLLLSTIITGKVNAYLLPKNNVPYSGIYIQPIGEKSLNEAKKILESQEFLEYVKNIGINASGESMRITSKDINEYVF